VQQMVDCDNVNFACEGGWMYDAFAYVKQYGIRLRGQYQRDYSQRKLSCLHYAGNEFHFKNLGMVEQDKNSNAQLKRLVARQPVSVAVYSSGMFMHYRAGVLTEDYLKCSSSFKSVNHGVLLVGYGKVQPSDRVRGKCKEYWIIRNSWGANWGENGFFRICMDGAGQKDKPFGTCLVNQWATWPNLDGTVIPPKD